MHVEPSSSYHACTHPVCPFWISVCRAVEKPVVSRQQPLCCCSAINTHNQAKMSMSCVPSKQDRGTYDEDNYTHASVFHDSRKPQLLGRFAWLLNNAMRKHQRYNFNPWDPLYSGLLRLESTSSDASNAPQLHPKCLSSPFHRAPAA